MGRLICLFFLLFATSILHELLMLVFGYIRRICIAETVEPKTAMAVFDPESMTTFHPPPCAFPCCALMIKLSQS